MQRHGFTWCSLAPGRQVQPPLLASACRNADLSAPALELCQWKRVLNHCKVCAGKSRRNQICLCCHSHFSSACSEGMGLKGCSGSWKEGEETNVNKNRLHCQSVSDVFGYPVLKVSKHIKVFTVGGIPKDSSSPWISRCIMDAYHSQCISTGRMERCLS